MPYGLKPTVRSDVLRTGCTVTFSSEGGGPRYDGDDGRGSSAFTSRSRAASLNHQRTRITPHREQLLLRHHIASSFFAKSTYTGTHAKDGPDHVPKAEGTVGHYLHVPTIMSNSRRASQELSTTTTVLAPAAGDDECVHMEAHRLTCQAVLRRRPNGARGAGTASYAPRPPSRCCAGARTPPGRHFSTPLATTTATSPLPPLSSGGSRPSSRGAGSSGRVPRGPEGALYDSVVPKSGGTSIDRTWKRPWDR